MSRPGLLTPASSTDLKAKDGITSLHPAFELPPPAIRDTTTTTTTTVPTPGQAAETTTAIKRRRSKEKDHFALPPPPTRSRKIIQMKPAMDAPSSSREGQGKPKPNAGAGGSSGSGNANGNAKGKKSATPSAAGRKIARKTAHSLIERRRRSKMNEEFSVLRNMIPACTGDMHKLAILQASIEYIRYLEDCVSQLKAHRKPSDANLPSICEFHPTQPADVHLSPIIDRHHQRRPSYSSDSFSMSATPSPAFGPQRPQTELDQEATAALLMLNNDRRGVARGLSVRDLLSG